jgi:hypothetical protein
MKDKAIELKKQYEREWMFWNQNSRRNFINRCKRIASKLDPKTATGDDAVAVVALDMIQTRSNWNIWTR